MASIFAISLLTFSFSLSEVSEPDLSLLLVELFAGGRGSASVLKTCFVGGGWLFGEAVRFGTDFLGAAREGFASPFVTFEVLFGGLEVGVDRGVDF